MGLLNIFGGGLLTGLVCLAILIYCFWHKLKKYIIPLLIILAVVIVIGLIEEASSQKPDSDLLDAVQAEEKAFNEEEFNEAMAYFDRKLDSIAALPSYRMAARVLDSLGYQIRPSMTFMAIDNTIHGGKGLTITGATNCPDSIVRTFVMKFEGTPLLYHSVRITDNKSNKLFFSDREKS